MREITLQRIDDYVGVSPDRKNAPARSRVCRCGMIKELGSEEALKQVANVAHLPGILKYFLAMPDVHWGDGFPLGGVAALDWDKGVVSPGGVG